MDDDVRRAYVCWDTTGLGIYVHNIEVTLRYFFKIVNVFIIYIATIENHTFVYSRIV